MASSPPPSSPTHRLNDSLVVRLPSGGEVTGNRLTLLLCVPRLQQVNNHHLSLSSIHGLKWFFEQLRKYEHKYEHKILGRTRNRNFIVGANSVGANSPWGETGIMRAWCRVSSNLGNSWIVASMGLIVNE